MDGFQLPPPPPDRARTTRGLFFVLALAFAAVGAVQASLLFALFGAFAGGITWLLARGRRTEVGGHLAMAALDRAARGRFGEARAILDAVSPTVLTSYVGQMVDSQRAALALYEGDLEASALFATRAAREGKRLYVTGRVHQASALSLRAVALAGLGRKEEALADVAKVRSGEYRQGSFLARASLAEALIFARERDLESLAKILRDDRALLFGATSMRERMVARALSRMVGARRISVYREAGKREEDELNENDSWVARIAPEAASYAKAPRLGTTLSAPEPVNRVVLAQAEKLAPQRNARTPFGVAIWAVLAASLLVVWQLLDTGPTYVAGARSTAISTLFDSPAVWLPLVVVLTGVIFFVSTYVRAKRAGAQIAQAMEKRARGLDDEARVSLEKLARSKISLVPPQAHRELASLATAAGDFRRAQEHAAAGIAGSRVNTTTEALARPLLLPQLYGELALAFAAAGNVQRAEEEVDRLRFFPSYPYLARDTFRARLVAAVAAGDLAEAAEMARSRPIDLPLSMNEELLCDALRVHAGDALPNGERERILLDVREAPADRFLDRLAPKLRTAPAQLRIAEREPEEQEELRSHDQEPAQQRRARSDLRDRE